MNKFRYTVNLLGDNYDVLAEFEFASFEEAIAFIKVCFTNGYRVNFEQN